MPSKGAVWTGRVLSALPVLLLALSAAMKFSRSPEVVKSFTVDFGYPESTLLVLGVVELTCAVLYAIPQTSVLGAILVTGYLGGATATHVRVSQAAFITPVLLGAMAWGGLYLRDPRLRELLPLRSKPPVR
jgi:hypothetical protein